jgi:hypothetical protein
MPTAENLQSIAKYRATAAGYDATTGPTWPIRMRCIALLQLRAGDTVLDVAADRRRPHRPPDCLRAES